MSASTKKSWWVTQPGALMSTESGGLMSGVGGLLLGVLLGVASLGIGLRAVTTHEGEVAIASLIGASFLGLSALCMMVAAEGSFGRAFQDSRRTSTARAFLGARVAVAASVLLGYGLELVELVAGTPVQRASGDLSDGLWLGAIALVPALVAGVLSRSLLRLDGVRWARVALGGAGFTGLLLFGGLAVTGCSWYATGSLAALFHVGGWALWTLAGSVIAVVMAQSARKRLAIWDGADRWRDATLTPDLRLVFADGSGSRAAAACFNGYAGPVVVMPTAAEAGAVFRGDGAPADGWVVPGTRAALEEAVRCARAMAAVTVAAVALVATAPLAVWLVSLIG